MPTADTRVHPQTEIRIWHDAADSFKKPFILQGFRDLARAEGVAFHAEPYAAFEKRGAPPIAGSSHSNILVGEISVAGKTVKIVYDANDIYYKIPSALLAWSDLYFKSNYQDEYFRTGQLLRGEFWDRIPFRDGIMDGPLDTSQAHKFRKASFSLQAPRHWLHRVAFYLHADRLWLKVPIERKSADVFFLGRYWQDSIDQTLALMDATRRAKLRLSGGIVVLNEQPPAAYDWAIHKKAGLMTWSKLASRSRLTLTTRGLQGCVGFKPLHLMLLGAPFVANKFWSNLYVPLVNNVNYIEVRDDFSDLEERVAAFDGKALVEMGKANYAHWQRYASPIATARYVYDEVVKLL